MPIDKTLDNYTAPRTTYTAPTTTTQPPPSGSTPSPSVGAPPPPPTGTTTQPPRNPLAPPAQKPLPPPPPTIQANAIVARVGQITRKQRPSVIASGSLSVAKSDVTINGRGFKRFIISFDDKSDLNSAGVRIWVKGYLTGASLAAGSNPDNIPWQLVRQARTSPIYLDLEDSSENIMIGAELINENGDGLLDLDRMEHVLTNTS